MAEALQKFDTDGSPIKWGDTKMTARVKDNKTYQSPYGSVQIQRYVYQINQVSGFFTLYYLTKCKFFKLLPRFFYFVYGLAAF